MAGFSRFLWNASTDFKNCFIQKNFDTNKTRRGRIVTFGKMTSSHQQKMTLFSRFLWNASTDFKNCFIQKNFDTNETQGWRIVTFGKMTSSHQQKRLCFFLSARRGWFRVLCVGQMPRSGVQNIGLAHTSRRFFYIFLNFDFKRENLKKKWKKRVLGWAKTSKHIAIY